jgi:hypothetical protein
MMWFPAKSAFRSGSAGPCPAASTAWDDANIGVNSWAGGNLTTASNEGAFAFGDQAVASGVLSVALGSASVSSGTITYSDGTSKAEGFGSHAMGYNNRAVGQGATSIGYRNGAIGEYSVALGYRAVTGAGCPTNSTCDLSTLTAANGFDGSFVFSDMASTNQFAATADNQFSARAAGGFRFMTNAALTTGCSLPAGSGVFSCTSDRNAKRNFTPVSGRRVLQRLAAIPITTWSYKTEKPGVRHMGPMAQDFRKAFGLGTDDKSIGQLDEAGVSFAAIKELSATAQRQQHQLDAQAAQIARLERQLGRR